MNSFWLIFQNIRWQDVVDILVVAILIYQIFLLMKGTRAVEIIVGMMVLLHGLSGRPENRVADPALDFE